MGLFEASVKIGAMNNGNPVFNAEVKLQVDTGATYTTIPAEVLDRVGVTRLGEMSVRMANGMFIKKSYGGAVLEVEGRIVAATVLFGEPGDFALLGATTLEQASMAVDPVGQRLVAQNGHPGLSASHTFKQA